MRRRASITVGVLVLSGAAGACGSTPANALQGKSPAQILQIAAAAAARLGAVHYVLQTSEGGAQQTVTGDASKTEGAQYIVSGTDQTVVQLIGTTLYVRGNASGLQDALGVPAAAASQFDGKWFTVHPGDPLYQSLAPELTLKSVMAHVVPVGSLAESTPGTVDGHRVVGVRGATAQAAHQGTATLWVTTAAPTVPIGNSTQTTIGTQSVTEVGNFSRWGERVHLVAPSGAVAYTATAAK